MAKRTQNPGFLVVLLLVVGLAACTGKKDGASRVQIDKDSIQTGASIDIERFKYEDRDAFKDLVSARLNAIERGLDSLDKNVGLGAIDGSGTTSASRPSEAAINARKTLISRVENQQKNLESRVGQIGDTERDQWAHLKETFKKDLVELESSYQNLFTAQR